MRLLSAAGALTVSAWSIPMLGFLVYMWLRGLDLKYGKYGINYY